MLQDHQMAPGIELWATAAPQNPTNQAVGLLLHGKQPMLAKGQSSLC